MSKNKTSKFSRKSEQSDTKKLVIGTLIGCIATMSILMVLSFAASTFVLKANNPDSLVKPIAYIITGISLLTGGIVGAKSANLYPITAGLAIGIICTVIAFCIHLILSGQNTSSTTSLLFLVYPLVSLLGAFIGTKKSKKSKPKFKSKF